jgi:hypothetical protein
MTMADGTGIGTESKSKKARATKAAPAYDPDKDHISTLLLELGQANAIVDLLIMVASEDQADSLCDGTLENSLNAVLMRLSAVKAAAEAILDEKTAAHKIATN